jgi:hypothetical protein
MPVSEAKEGTPVAPDHVYVMPRNTSMAIEGGALRLRPREEGRGLADLVAELCSPDRFRVNKWRGRPRRKKAQEISFGFGD